MPCPRWVSFLDQIFDSDVETIESVQRLLGYTLTGLVTEEVLVICHGYGSNGKSVFNNVVQRIMGGYSRTAPTSLLSARRSDDSSPRNDLAALAGARYVSVNELQAGDRLDEQVVKQLAGREAISARFLHKEFFEYMPTFTAWLRTNHKPVVTGGDDGIWRRLVLVPFKRKFEDHEKDSDLEAKLMAERDGILMWMLEGTRKYLQDGLKLSPRVRAEAAQYRKDSDRIGEFLEDIMEADAGAKINQQTAFKEWDDWSKANGFRPSSKKSFTQRLAERGYSEGKSGRERFYVGLKTHSNKVQMPLKSTQAETGGLDRLDGIIAVSANSENISSQEQITGNSKNPVQPVQPVQPVHSDLHQTNEGGYMKYRTCHESYHHGVSLRFSCPLSLGRYKLLESQQRIQRAGEEVVRIRDVINKVIGRYELTQCTYEDKAYWLRGVPLNVAYRMGYEVVPSLRALVADGVPLAQAEAAAKYVESVIDNYLAQWEALRETYSKTIGYEYTLMRGGHSNAMKVVDSALSLIDLAVSRLPTSIQQEIWKP